MSKVPHSLIVRGGTIIGASRSFTGDTLVKDGRIASTAEPGTLDGATAIDTTGILTLAVRDTILELGRLHGRETDGIGGGPVGVSA